MPISWVVLLLLMFSHSVMSNSLGPDGLQHARLLCSPLSSPLSWWCPSHPLPPPSLFAFNLPQHQDLFQWISFSHQVAKILEFHLSIHPSNEYPGLMSFRIDWFDVFAVRGTLKSLPQPHNLKASILWCLTFFVIQFSLINFNLFMFKLTALYSNLTPLLASLEQFPQGYLKCCLLGLKS